MLYPTHWRSNEIDIETLPKEIPIESKPSERVTTVEPQKTGNSKLKKK